MHDVELSDRKGIRRTYAEQGYAVVSKLINENKTNSLIEDSNHEHNEDYVGAISNKLKHKGYKKTDCKNKKGDVVFWHSCNIHGSNENVNPAIDQWNKTDLQKNIRHLRYVIGFFPNSIQKKQVKVEMKTIEGEYQGKIFEGK